MTCSNRCANVLKIKNFPVFSSLPGRNSYFSLARWSGFLTIKPKRRFSYEFLTSYEFLPSKNLLKRSSAKESGGRVRGNGGLARFHDF
jgi:hypothetical protein